MDKTLVFRISKDGQEIKMEALGFVGAECKDRTRPFRERLGIQGQEEDRPEYYEETVDDDVIVGM